MSKAAEVITVTLGGRTFRAGRRTAAHLEWTIERLAARHPDARLIVIQGSYNTGVDASAGTHDFDGVIDLAILGMDWFPAQRFMREHGWAAWYRFPPSFGHHIHAISLGCPGPVGALIDGQILDYHNHAFGLKNQHEPGSDKSWFPADIDATEFDYQRWVDRVTPGDMDKINAAIAASEDRVVSKLLKALVDGDPRTTVERALREGAEAARIIKQNAKES